MIFTSEEELPNNTAKQQSIFLAGSMDTQLFHNWRKQVIDTYLGDYNFFDPTNRNYEKLNFLDMKLHIQWELDALEMSDKILLNFLPDALSPISLVELGLYVSSNKLIVVCPKEFYKSSYVHALCEKYNTPIFNEINSALTELY
jgi:hypothetical protein